MRTLIGIALPSLLLLGLGIGQGSSSAIRSIRGDVFTKGTNGKPAVMPGARIVLHGLITKETGSDTQGAFAIDGLPPGFHEIEANAPGLYSVLAAEVRDGRSSTVLIEMNVAAVPSTTSTQLTGLKATDRAFSGKVQHV